MSDKNTYIKDDLENFENDIASLYQTGYIKAPIHLRSGNELQLIEIFRNINHDAHVENT